MSNSKFVSCSLAIIVTSFFVCLPADAQPLSTGKANSVVVKLDVKDTSKCNIEVSTPWQEKFEVEVNPPSMEAQFEVTPREPGLLVLTWTGKTKFRGLKSVMACTGSGEVRLIAGYTSEAAKPMWDKLFSTLSSEQAECVRIGLDSAKLKYTAIDPRAEVIDPTDSKAKSVFARCESFFKIKQGFIDKGTWSETQLTSCTVGGVRTMCEGAYGIPLADGKFMPLSRIDAMRYHHENRPWTLYRREPQSLRDARLAQAEQTRLEEERQREAKRVADEKIAADRAKQAEEERQREAKRIAEEERQREAKRIAEERSAMEKAKAQKNQDKKNIAKDILGGGANPPKSDGRQGSQPKLSVALQRGMEYKWFSDGSCSSQQSQSCISKEDYKALCLSASGTSQSATWVLASFKPRARELLRNGNIDKLTVSWQDGYKYGCRVFMQVSGILQGSSAREQLEGGVSTFVFNEEGKLLAHFASEINN